MVQYDVFISHSSVDDQLAGDVMKLLEHNNIKAFCTPTSIPSGKREPQIEKALQNSTDVWVLLTANALERSVWVHHELGYFYGFRHGRGLDELGNHSRYMYQEGVLQLGLYAQLQGVKVETIGDPIQVAKTIASHLNLNLEIPPDWQNRTYDTHGQNGNADEDKFQDECIDFSNEIVSKIQGVGHRKATIRPLAFDANRVSDFLTLRRIVGDSHVRHFEWHCPSFDQSGGQSGANWFGDSFDGELPESWRLYQSGQFVHFWAFSNELSDDAIQRGIRPDRVISASSAVNYLTCVYEFAAKIASTEVGDQTIVIETSANNLSGRAEAERRGLVSSGIYQTQADRLPV